MFHLALLFVSLFCLGGVLSDAEGGRKRPADAQAVKEGETKRPKPMLAEADRILAEKIKGSIFREGVSQISPLLAPLPQDLSFLRAEEREVPLVVTPLSVILPLRVVTIWESQGPIASVEPGETPPEVPAAVIISDTEFSLAFLQKGGPGRVLPLLDTQLAKKLQINQPESRSSSGTALEEEGGNEGPSGVPSASSSEDEGMVVDETTPPSHPDPSFSSLGEPFRGSPGDASLESHIVYSSPERRGSGAELPFIQRSHDETVFDIFAEVKEAALNADPGWIVAQLVEKTKISGNVSFNTFKDLVFAHVKARRLSPENTVLAEWAYLTHPVAQVYVGELGVRNYPRALSEAFLPPELLSFGVPFPREGILRDNLLHMKLALLAPHFPRAALYLASVISRLKEDLEHQRDSSTRWIREIRDEIDTEVTNLRAFEEQIRNFIKEQSRNPQADPLFWIVQGVPLEEVKRALRAEYPDLAPWVIGRSINTDIPDDAADEEAERILDEAWREGTDAYQDAIRQGNALGYIGLGHDMRDPLTKAVFYLKAAEVGEFYGWVLLAKIVSDYPKGPLANILLSREQNSHTLSEREAQMIKNVLGIEDFEGLAEWVRSSITGALDTISIPLELESSLESSDPEETAAIRLSAQMLLKAEAEGFSAAYATLIDRINFLANQRDLSLDVNVLEYIYRQITEQDSLEGKNKLAWLRKIPLEEYAKEDDIHGIMNLAFRENNTVFYKAGLQQVSRYLNRLKSLYELDTPTLKN